MSRPGTNPNFSQIGHPIADLGALRVVCEQLKQNVDSIGGLRGGQFDRAVTFQDLIDMGVIDALIATSPSGSSKVDGAQYYPANPTGTASASPGVMMGLKATFAPRRTGALFVAVSGLVINSTAGDSVELQMLSGAGTPPSNGGSVVGADAAPAQIIGPFSTGGQQFGFCTQAIIVGTTLNSDYWFDLRLAAITGGTASIKSVSLSIVEL